MSAGTIFEIGRVPIDPDKRMTANDIPEDFYMTIAEYIDDECDRGDNLKYFIELFGDQIQVSDDGESFMFRSTTKETYFRRKYRAFIKKATELAGVSLDTFVGKTPYPISSAMHELNRSFSDRFGNYIYCDEELVPLDQWVREESLKGTYYFGETIDFNV